MTPQYSLPTPQFHARRHGLTGQTPQAWLRERRLDEAERLLRAGCSGEAVVLHVGYASASVLRRKRGVGCA